MVAAAAADGEIDSQERERILGRFGSDGLSAEEQAFLQGELAAPATPEALAAAAAGRADLAQAVYLAALLAVEVDTDAERQWFGQLAAALRLTPEQVAELQLQRGL